MGKGAKSSQTQDVFRTIVNDTIVQNDTTILISNMRKSIQATNVTLNVAVVPNVILMPSNFIILSDKIEGYNNILTTATNEMEFGVNKDVNYEKPKPKRKRESKSKPNLIDDYKHINSGSERSDSSNVDRSSNGISRSDNTSARVTETSTALVPLLMVSLAAGMIVSKII